ncbi:hypothetical protein [Holdemanella porci]
MENNETSPLFKDDCIGSALHGIATSLETQIVQINQAFYKQ